MPSHKAILLACTTLAVLLRATQAFTEKGVVSLDDYTYDRVVDGSRNVVVRFDKEYAWGDEYDAFKKLAKKVGESGVDVLMTAVPISKSNEDKKNQAIAARYDVEEKDWPVYKIFSRGTNPRAAKPASYTGDKKNVEAMMQWIAAETGAFFGLKGQLQAFDAVAKKLASASSVADREALVKEADGLLSSVTDTSEKEYAQYYIKVLRKAVDNPQWPSSEASRLQRVLEDKSVAQAKKDGLQIKLNTLGSFAGNQQKKVEL